MTELFDLFERDFFTDVQALTNIGKRISGNNEIMIQFINSTEAVYTDCRFIYLPSKYKSDIKSAQGLVAHESGHIGYGSFEVGFIKLVDTLANKYKMPHFFVKNVLNVVEDVRINAINNKKYPGFYRNLRILTKKMLPNLISRIESISDILLLINLYLEDYDGFQLKPELKHIVISDDDWEGISKVKKFLFKSLTPSASIIVCDILCKILKNYFSFEEMNKFKEINSLRGINNNTIRNIEALSKENKRSEKTKLDKISESLINKLKDINLKPEDLESIIKDPESINQDDVNKGKKKKSKKKGTKHQKNKTQKNEKNEELKPNTDEDKPNRMEFDSKEQKHKETILKQIIQLFKEADNAMKERLIILEKAEYMIIPHNDKGKRNVRETKIENMIMKPEGMSYSQIKTKYMNIIGRMRLIFSDLKNKSGIDPFQKNGRLNNKFIKAVTSDYKFKKCFTRKLLNKELKLLVMVDISGSMRGIKIQVAKIALVILSEALEGLAKIKIVLFTGIFHALNILVKDFDEILKPNKIDKFGCHSREGENIDGVSIKHEASKLEKDDIIIVISDGQPAAQGGYNLEDAIPDIHQVRKKFKVFAFSIDSQGDYLNKMYGNDWVLTSSSNQIELGQKMIKFCQIIAREFFR
ncbi:MAG: hypothetical protein ACFE75_08715 [Candidatus Hodarchaeota archaeon]